MNSPVPRRLRHRVMTLLALTALVAGALVTSPAALAQDPAPTPGANVSADPQSPTGYTVTFVYHNPDATQVRLGGDLTLLDLDTGRTVRYQPERNLLAMARPRRTEISPRRSCIPLTAR